jgi:hypothetical protein
VNCLISGHHWEAEAIASASKTIPALTATLCPESFPLAAYQREDGMHNPLTMNASMAFTEFQSVAP